MMPLIFSTNEQSCIIKKINGRDETKRHLNSLGFVEGENIKVISENLGNYIVSVKDVRIAISREMASRIIVE